MRVLQGITALIAANILRGTDFAAMERGSAEHYHAMIEAIRCGSPLLSSPLIALIDLFCTHTHTELIQHLISEIVLTIRASIPGRVACDYLRLEALVL